MTVRLMTIEELQTVLDWAADEGWNPGVEDSAAFHAADPGGFFVKEIKGEPVAAISVVNHDVDFAFLGFYLCKPAFRGRGHGMAVWRAGIAHAGARCIGLDGVPDQQANYARSGFAKFGSTVRFEGQIDADRDKRVRPASSAERPYLINYDAKAWGMNRTPFATAWFSQTATRQTVVLADGSAIEGFATFRRCRSGTKVGPLYAQSESDAVALLASDPFKASSEAVLVDAMGHETALTALLKKHSFAPIFETARMYTGTPPESSASLFQAIATMELG